MFRYMDADECHPWQVRCERWNFHFAPSDVLVAQNFLAYLLEGANNAEMAKGLPAGLNGVRATSRDGDCILVVWAKTERDVQSFVVPSGADVYDLWGNEINGDESLFVTTDPVYVIEKNN